ncbi:hypothetical protein EYS14_20285 [Alteromonadaceae bacterium M269]|nr:hypothetical protein EYS14_20285 [Alteromonadaceae bacterium M269]
MSVRRRYLFLGILLCSSFFSFLVCAEEPQIIAPTEYFLSEGDDARYASPDIDRSFWQRHEYNGLPLSNDIFWVQYDFLIEHTPEKPLGLLISLLGAYEIYWDGEFIDENGRVGADKDAEIPGDIDKIVLIPQHLVEKGKHTVSLRISSQYRYQNRPSGSFWSFVSEYEYLTRIPYVQASRPMVMSGALLLVALYTLFVFTTALRQPSYLIFSGLCFVILSLIVAESWRGMWGYTYDWQVPRLIIVLGLSTAVGVLLIAFFCWFFDLRKGVKRSCIGGALLTQAVILLSFDGFDERSLYVFLIGIVGAVLICALACYQKQRYAPIMLIGLLLFLAPIFVNIYAYMDQYFFISFSGLMVLMLYTLANTMASKQKQLMQSQITAGRLELELVKRQLQPHFILNTLTAIEEWIEESPATAVKFIQALADEFRYMAEMSSRQLISLQDEVSLCQSHIKVMGYRTNVQFSLSTRLTQSTLPIPPGVLLTFLENAISHNHYVSGQVSFELVQAKVNERYQEIALKVPITQKLGQDKSETGIRLGIGSQYIKARMKESYGSDWEMGSSMDSEYWQVKLHMPIRETSESVDTVKAVSA